VTTAPGRTGRRVALVAAVELTCTGEVQATSGPVLRLYPLGERGPWIIVSEAVLLSVAWVYSRPRRSR